MVARTKTDTAIRIIEKDPLKQHNQVDETTLDITTNKRLITKKYFPNAVCVTDEFYV
jgi:hypothetical protein